MNKMVYVTMMIPCIVLCPLWLHRRSGCGNNELSCCKFDGSIKIIALLQMLQSNEHKGSTNITNQCPKMQVITQQSSHCILIFIFILIFIAHHHAQCGSVSQYFTFYFYFYLLLCVSVFRIVYLQPLATHK